MIPIVKIGQENRPVYTVKGISNKYLLQHGNCPVCSTFDSQRVAAEQPQKDKSL